MRAIMEVAGRVVSVRRLLDSAAAARSICRVLGCGGLREGFFDLE